MNLWKSAPVRTLIYLVVGMMLLTASVTIAQAQEKETTIHGTIKQGGNMLAGQHEIEARWGPSGPQAGKATSENGGWVMDIYLPQSAGASGSTLHFYVNQVRVAQTAAWPWDKNPVELEIPLPAPVAQPPQPTYTPYPTQPPYPTNTPYPTEAPRPTAAPEPTRPPEPTYTPMPTYTPVPTPEPTPTATPATPSDTAGGRVEGFDTPPRVALRPVVDVISADEDGLIEFAMANPRRNQVNLEVELVLRVPSGIHIYSSDGTYASGAGMGTVYYLVQPGDTRTIQFFVQADKAGKFTISGTAEYGPEHHRGLWNPISLTHPFVVEQATSRSRVRTPETAPATAPRGDEGGPQMGCQMGSPDGGTDIAALMLGGTMLTGLGMIMVRRRR